MPERHPRNVYAAIMVAADRGTGLVLTADEVFDLSRDDAIATAAQNSLTPEQEKLTQGGWARLDPRKVGKHGDLDPQRDAAPTPSFRVVPES